MKYIFQSQNLYSISLLDMDIAVENIQNGAEECIFITEHPAIFSAGKSSMPEDFIAKHNIPICYSKRGGKVTVHSLGQIVVYPIINISKRNINISEFVKILENWMIDVLQKFQIIGCTSNQGIGVWTNNAKIGFVGIKIQNGVSSHGLALNVSNNLSLFKKIIPCGMHIIEITSVEKILNQKINLKTIANFFINTSPF